MDLKEIMERLKKEKDPEKFLRKILNKIKDKKLREKIKGLLEKKESYGESPLEKVVRNVRVPRREPEVRVHVPESVQERSVSRTNIRPDLVVDGKKGEDYGGSIGGKSYKTGSIVKQLEESHLVAEGGHLTTSETKGLIDQKMGEYDLHKESDKYSGGESKYENKPV